MNKEILKKAKKMAQEEGFDDVRLAGKWKAYDVMEPVCHDDEPQYTGFPQYILVKDGKMRWTESEAESRAVMESI